MRQGRKIGLAILCLLAAGGSAFAGRPAKGAWSGGVSLDGGTGFKDYNEESDYKFSNFLGEASANIGWKGEKFSIKADFSFNNSYKSITGFGATVTQSGEDLLTFKEDIESDIQKIHDTKGSINVLWSPGKNDDFDLTFSINSKKKDFSKGALTFDLAGFLEDPEYGEVLFLTCGSEGYVKNISSAGKINWTHLMAKSGQKITVRLETSAGDEDDEEVWEKGSLEDFDIESYNVNTSWRTTPRYGKFGTSVCGKFSDGTFLDVKDLAVDLSLEAAFGQDRDNYRSADLKDGVWVDSPSGCEFFHYRKTTLSPTAHARWTDGGLTLEGSLTPQYFSDRLTAEGYDEDFDKGRVDILTNFIGSYDFLGGHRLGLSLDRNIKRPTYLNLCWFTRQGTLSDELISGNTSLRPSILNKFGVNYTYTRGRFCGGLELGYLHESDRIEYTFNESSGYRVYTWINAGWSNTANAKLSANWTAERFKAYLMGNLKYYKGVTESGVASENFDYEINGNASYSLNRGWLFLVRGRYQSKIIRTYSSMTDYIGCDVRVEKKFGKNPGVSVFLEGRDLFDMDIRIGTYSSDLSYCREETYDYCRRLILLGASLSF